ncbi:PST family polysaccharide transporter [Salinibacter ruber]|uniref:oligosaccharide flippase family protein n=1 Tax=Salinibacter ruber TaxID=146919 RepID=UPI00207399B3|nr:oligosaccharide flippase family protein [Salinibacter ruber]MCS4044985.1 PST family polysaccharide transporter [Salinibacter ruber]
MYERVAAALRSRLFQEGSWMMGGGTLKVGISFLANLALVRLLTPNHFGEFAIIQAIVSLVGAFLNFRTGPLLLQAPEEELHPHALARYTGALIAETLLIGGIASIVLAVFGYLHARSMVLLVATLAGTWVQMERVLYERSFEYKSLSIIETIAQACAHGFAVAGAFAGIGSFVLYLRNPIRQSILSIGLYWAGAIQTLPVRWLTVQDWTHILDRLKGFWTDGVLVRLFDRATVLIVGAIAGEQTTGFFFQARKLATAPDKILGPITNRVAFNYFSNRVEPGHRYDALRKSLLFFGVPLVVCAFLAALLADPIIPWVFGEEWKPAVPILQAMIGVVVGMPLLSLVKAYSMSRNSMRRLILAGRGVQFSVLAVSVLVVWILSKNAGIGFGIAFSLSYLLAIIATIISIRK